jgi:hypothetical protein
MAAHAAQGGYENAEGHGGKAAIARQEHPPRMCTDTP